ncbi:MAG: hypothetical protein INH34_15285 [Phycisphaerales bacterium]|jgi:hypothetical protein|nr:hypothetical protein [Phycisphaerales bacterium]
MNFARTNLRNPLACPTAATPANRLTVAAPARLAIPVATSAHRWDAKASARPRTATAPASQSLAEQIGAGAMILFFLVLALFG